MSNGNGTSEVQAALDAVDRLGEVHDVTNDDLTTQALIVVAKGREIVDLKPFIDKRRTKPERIEGTARLTTLDAFVGHVNRFKDECSAIFADDTPKRPKLTAIYDYHQRHGEPRFGSHRAVYDFPLSDEWLAWRTLVEQGFVSQETLALFLEDHLPDVFPPDQLLGSTRERATRAGIELGGPSTIAGLAKNLSINIAAEFTQATTLATGEGQLIFKESHTASVKVPSGFALSIPVFRGGLAEDVLVRLRYRPQGDKVVFSVTLYDVDALFRRAFRDACTRVETATAIDAAPLSLFFGSPE